MCFFAETRRSSENDSQSCDVPGFLKLGWSFKQLPKVRGSVSFGNDNKKVLFIYFLNQIVNVWFVYICHSFFQSCLTWSIFGISICCCLSSHVMDLNHMVGHRANSLCLINYSIHNITSATLLISVLKVTVYSTVWNDHFSHQLELQIFILTNNWWILKITYFLLLYTVRLQFFSFISMQKEENVHKKV